MKNIKDKELYLGFTHYKRMDYADVGNKLYVDKIVFGIYVENEGCVSESAVIWEKLAERTVPYIRIFADGVTAAFFTNFFEVAKQLSEMGDYTPEQLSELLIQCGFRDDSDKPLKEDKGE